MNIARENYKTLCLDPEFNNRIFNAFGQDGRVWLNELPRIVAESEAQFEIKIIEPLDKLSYNFVAEATQSDGREIIVKFCAPGNEFLFEKQALEFMRGSSAVALINYDEKNRVLVLEKLVPGEPLITIADDEQATLIAAEVMKKLWKPIDQSNHNFPTTQLWFNRLSQSIELPMIFPKKLINKARGLAQNLHSSCGQLVLLHGDLHHQNIISAQREPWLAIDPKGIVGEREYEVGALLRNPIPEIVTKRNTQTILAKRVDILAEHLGFEPFRIIAWSFCQAVLAAVWCLDETNPHWENFMQCALSIDEIWGKHKIPHTP